MKFSWIERIDGRYLKGLGILGLVGWAVGINLSLQEILVHDYWNHGMYGLIWSEFRAWFPLGFLLGFSVGTITLFIGIWVVRHVLAIERVRTDNVGWYFLLVPVIYIPGMTLYFLLTASWGEFAGLISEIVSNHAWSNSIWTMVYHMGLGITFVSLLVVLYEKFPRLFTSIKFSIPTDSLKFLGRIINGLVTVGLVLALLFLLVPGFFIQDHGDKRPNVIILGIDTLRADHLPMYGYNRNTAPALEKFSRPSVVFEKAYSSTSWTLPAFHSLLTGLYVKNHGVNSPFRQLAKSRFTLAEILKNEGYRTEAIVSGANVKSIFGFDQGYDRFDEEATTEGKQRRLAVTSPTVTKNALTFLQNRADNPFFLFVHFWDPHMDFRPPSPYDDLYNKGYEGPIGKGEGLLDMDSFQSDMPREDLEELIALYDGEIRWTDAHIRLLFERLKQQGLYNNSLIVVMGDHGEEFFEHGEFGHGQSLYNEVVRVPLMIKLPGQNQGSAVPQKVSIVDVVPTILDLLNVAPPEPLDGKSLIDWIQADQPSSRPKIHDRIYQELDVIDLRFNELQFSVVAGKWKYIQTPREGTEELYNLEEDPGEKHNLLEQKPGRVETLRNHLTRWRQSPSRFKNKESEKKKLDQETQEQLEGLGYID